MSETPTAAELEIPAASVRIFVALADKDWDGTAIATEVERIARPVVAAELRRIADRHVTAVFTPDTEWEAAEMHATEKVVGELRARADVLDPPSRQEDCR